MTPVVSVIIPTYERVAFLRRAIGCALDQTFRDLEVIVVDDGPSDEIARMVEAHPDPRVRLVRHEVNQGVAAARNTGIAQAQGRYVAFLDDDDLWLPEKLEHQLPLLEAGADVTHTLVVIADADGRPYEGPSEDGFRLYREVAAAGYPYDWLLRRSSFFINTFVVRRTCVDEIGGFASELAGVDDLDFVHRLRRRFDFVLLDEPLTKNCFHGRNLSSANDPSKWLALAERELAYVATADVRNRRAIEAYLHMQTAQAHWIAGSYRHAVRPALRARRLDRSILSARTLAKYVVAAAVPPPLADRVRERHRETLEFREPYPFVDLWPPASA